MALVRQRVNPELENDILTALIVSTAFVERVVKWYNPKYFTDYTAIVAQWVIEYWQTYRTAPGKYIQNIYNVKKDELEGALSQNISAYLNNLNATYEQAADIHLTYMIEQAHKYFRRKAYEQLYTNGKDLMLAGQVDEAIQLHEQFRDVAQVQSLWENPFDPDVVRQHFADKDADIYSVFRFRDALGQLVGDLEVGWLLAWLGPMKRGKSFWIQESLFRSAVAKQNTAYINLEMIGKGVRDREYARLTGLKEGGLGHNIRLPVFDCYHNQTGECPMASLRTNDIKLRMDGIDAPKPVWGTPGLDEYRICNACRDDAELKKAYYDPDIWYTTYDQKRDYSRKVIETASGGFMRMYGDRIRQITYPAYSVTISDIQRDLNELAYAHNFPIKTVLVDYADIVEAEVPTGDDLSHLNQVWKAMKRTAGEMKALWITGSQTNRKAIDYVTVGQRDVAGDIRKLAHVDVMLSINQTNWEKEDLLTRISTLAHRHKKFTNAQVAVLHQLAIGLPYIDSEWWDLSKTMKDEKEG